MLGFLIYALDHSLNWLNHVFMLRTIVKTANKLWKDLKSNTVLFRHCKVLQVSYIISYKQQQLHTTCHHLRLGNALLLLQHETKSKPG